MWRHEAQQFPTNPTETKRGVSHKVMAFAMSAHLYTHSNDPQVCSSTEGARRLEFGHPGTPSHFPWEEEFHFMALRGENSRGTTLIDISIHASLATLGQGCLNIRSSYITSRPPPPAVWSRSGAPSGKRCVVNGPTSKASNK